MVADVLAGFEDAPRVSNTQRSKSIPKKLLLSKDTRVTMESLIDGGGFTTHCFDYTSKKQGACFVHYNGQVLKSVLDAVHCLFSELNLYLPDEEDDENESSAPNPKSLPPRKIRSKLAIRNADRQARPATAKAKAKADPNQPLLTDFLPPQPEPAGVQVPLLHIPTATAAPM